LLTYSQQLSHQHITSMREVGPLFILDETMGALWSHRLLAENATQTRYGYAVRDDQGEALTWESKGFVLDMMG
jgi:hypothetical protein